MLSIPNLTLTVPYNGPYQGAPPERGIFYRGPVYERGRISLVEVYERVEKSVTLDRKKGEKGHR